MNIFAKNVLLADKHVLSDTDDDEHSTLGPTTDRPPQNCSSSSSEPKDKDQWFNVIANLASIAILIIMVGFLIQVSNEFIFMMLYH